MAGWLQALVVLGLVGVLHVPLGDHLARVFTATRHWRAETVIYRACGINPDDDQPWTHYAVSVLAVSGAGMRLPAAAGAGRAAVLVRPPWPGPGARLQYRGQLHHQHQLAELRG